MVRISDAELEVMNVIWEKESATSFEIINELKEFNWSDNTVRTLIKRLVDKKAIGILKKTGKTYIYVAKIKEDEYRLKRIKNFLKQFYNGSLNEMVMNFISSDEISKDELKSLVEQINKK